MARPHGRDDAGRPLDLIGQPLGIRHAPPPQPFIVKRKDAMAKADSNGVYILNGGRYVVREGDVLPEGAKFEAIDADAPNEDQVAQRARDAAPENKRKQAAPENRAKTGA